MKNPLVSVVVPVYNVERYLKQCLESIVKQTYKNLEIILVDDGSTDQSGKLCDKWRRKDERVKVYHKENGGLSDARNYGIERASGEYIMFVDSDDTLELNAVELLQNVIVRDNVRMSIAAYNLVLGKRLVNKGDGFKDKILSQKEALARLLQEKGYAVSAWAKMYATELFSDIRFPRGKIFEDNGTTYKIILKCDKIGYSNHAVYNYYKRKGTLTTMSFSKKKLDFITLSDKMCEDILMVYPDLETQTLNKQVDVRFAILPQMFGVKLSKKEKDCKQDITNFLKSNKVRVLKDKNMNNRTRWAMRIFSFGTPIYRLTWRFYRRVAG